LYELEEAAYQVEDLMKANPQILRVASSISSGNPQAEGSLDGFPSKRERGARVPIQVKNSRFIQFN
jgi:hypothetical protein